MRVGVLRDIFILTHGRGWRGIAILVSAACNSTQSFQAVGCIAVVGTVGCVRLIADSILSTVVDALCMLR